MDFPQQYKPLLTQWEHNRKQNTFLQKFKKGVEDSSDYNEKILQENIVYEIEAEHFGEEEIVADSNENSNLTDNKNASSIVDFISFDESQSEVTVINITENEDLNTDEESYIEKTDIDSLPIVIPDFSNLTLYCRYLAPNKENKRPLVPYELKNRKPKYFKKPIARKKKYEKLKPFQIGRELSVPSQFSPISLIQRLEKATESGKYIIRNIATCFPESFVQVIPNLYLQSALHKKTSQGKQLTKAPFFEINTHFPLAKDLKQQCVISRNVLFNSYDYWEKATFSVREETKQNIEHFSQKEDILPEISMKRSASCSQQLQAVYETNMFKIVNGADLQKKITDGTYNIFSRNIISSINKSTVEPNTSRKIIFEAQKIPDRIAYKKTKEPSSITEQNIIEEKLKENNLTNLKQTLRRSLHSEIEKPQSLPASDTVHKKKELVSMNEEVKGNNKKEKLPDKKIEERLPELKKSLEPRLVTELETTHISSGSSNKVSTLNDAIKNETEPLEDKVNQGMSHEMLSIFNSFDLKMQQQLNGKKPIGRKVGNQLQLPHKKSIVTDERNSSESESVESVENKKGKQ